MSVALRPSLLDDLGLVPALRWYLDRQSARGGFEAHFEADPEIEATSEVQTACFRIAQEALTNVSRHAAASRVRLEVRQAGGQLPLAVSDDGKGFDVARVFERYGRRRQPRAARDARARAAARRPGHRASPSPRAERSSAPSSRPAIAAG